MPGAQMSGRCPATTPVSCLHGTVHLVCSVSMQRNAHSFVTMYSPLADSALLLKANVFTSQAAPQLVVSQILRYYYPVNHRPVPSYMLFTLLDHCCSSAIYSTNLL